MQETARQGNSSYGVAACGTRGTEQGLLGLAIQDEKTERGEGSLRDW